MKEEVAAAVAITRSLREGLKNVRWEIGDFGWVIMWLRKRNSDRRLPHNLIVVAFCPLDCGTNPSDGFCEFCPYLRLIPSYWSGGV